MRAYAFEQFGLDSLKIVEAPTPQPGPGEVRVALRARSLNFRDLLVVSGLYNKKLPLPATPLSDGAGVVDAVGDGVEGVAVGDGVMGHFVSEWLEGPYRGKYLGSTLGTPGPGLAADEVVLPASAVVPIPLGWSFEEAATLPIAALTAWSALVTEGGLRGGAQGRTVLTLGTGGVSLFALQFAKALGAEVVITSSQDEKLQRARDLGADHTINYSSTPRWEKAVLEACGGADVVVETGGAGTLTQSLRATRPGGVIGMLGALTGLRAEIDISPVLMKRIRIAGIMVDSRQAFIQMCAFLGEKDLKPVIDARFDFEDLPAALGHMKAGTQFGKIVLV